MILKCPSCNSKIKSFFENLHQPHTCKSCKLNFIPDKNIGFSIPYDHLDFIDAINDNSIRVIMSNDDAESIISQSSIGKLFCKLLTLFLIIPWIGLFLIGQLTDINENWKLIIFAITCLTSGFLHKTFSKIKIDKAAKLLKEDSNLYNKCLCDAKFQIFDNPSFKNY
jgi:hypothetical protein